MMERLATGGPVLVHFFEAAELAPVRTLPYVEAWFRRYSEAGLSVVGVHSPRYRFTTGAEALERAARTRSLGYPLVADDRHDIWSDHGCRGWPSLFLYGQGGALRWFHFGEGAYDDTEGAIRQELAEAGPLASLPEEVGFLREADRPDALLARPTPEVRPGPSSEEPWEATPQGDTLSLSYRAGGAHAILEGPGAAFVSIDEGPAAEIAVDAPGLYELAGHAEHGRHELVVRLEPGMRLWALQFSPGLA